MVVVSDGGDDGIMHMNIICVQPYTPTPPTRKRTPSLRNLHAPTPPAPEGLGGDSDDGSLNISNYLYG